MVAQQSIGLTLVSPESISDNSDRLWIVQPEWPEAQDSGFISWARALGVGMSINNIGSLLSRYKSHCSDSGLLEVEIQVHRSRADLDYTATASYGELSEGIEQTVEISRSITFEGVAEVDMETLFSGPVSGKWEGDVYDIKGNKLWPPPQLTVDGSRLVAAQEVVGAYRLEAVVDYTLHILTIEPREAGEYDPADRRTAFQSTVMAIYSGQVESHEVDLPDMSGNCQGGVGGTVNPGDPADEECVRHVVVVNPCTKEIIEEFDEPIPCPGDDAAEEDL